MATNEVYDEARYIPLTVGASVAARHPVAVGQITGVTLTATGSSGTTTATVAREGVFDLSVKAVDKDGNSAVAEGDIIYFVVGDTPHLSKKQTGVRFGYALEGITLGQTDTINVLLGY